MRPSSFCLYSKTGSEGSKKHESRQRYPCIKSTPNSSSAERSEQHSSRRPHRLCHHDNTPLIIQAAILPIELSKPTTPPTHYPQSVDQIRRTTTNPQQTPETDFQYQRFRPTHPPSPPPLPPPPPPTILPPPPPPPPPPSYLPQHLPPPSQPSIALQPAPLNPGDFLPSTTFSPPSAVQEPITSAPYGGGQPPSKPSNPQVPSYPPLTQINPLPPPSQVNFAQAGQTQYKIPSYQQQFQQPISGQPYPQPPLQTQNPPVPQARARSQTQPQTNTPSLPAAVSPPQAQGGTQAPSRATPGYPATSNSPRPPLPASRFSDTGIRNSTVSNQRFPPYPPSKPVLPMPKPPPQLQQMLQQQEEQRKQQQLVFLQHQLQSLQSFQQRVSTTLEEDTQRQHDVDTGRESPTVDSQSMMADTPSNDPEKDFDDTENQSNGETIPRPSLKQRPRPSKRIMSMTNRISPMRATPPSQTVPQRSPSTCCPQLSNGIPQRPGISTVPPHPYGTIVPWFSAQNAFHATHHPTTNQPLQMPTQMNRVTIAPAAPVMHAEFKQSPTVAYSMAPKPMTSNFGTNCSPNASEKQPQNAPQQINRSQEYRNENHYEYTTGRTPPALAEAGAEGTDDRRLPQTSESQQSQQQPQQKPLQQVPQHQGIQTRLSRVNPLHSPALQTTHVMGSLQMRCQQSPPQTNESAHANQEELQSERPSTYPAKSSSVGITQLPFSQRCSYSQGPMLSHQQQCQAPQWQPIQRQAPNTQTFIQLGTFPPNMMTRPPTGTFVQNITERPMKLSLTPPRSQNSQLSPQNISNVGVGIRSANSCPGDIRVGGNLQGMMLSHRQGSPHAGRARSAGRESPPESTVNVWGSNSNPHHLP